MPNEGAQKKNNGKSAGRGRKWWIIFLVHL